MDEIYVTYVDDEHVDNHDYGDNIDDHHDNNNDIYARACNARLNTSILYDYWSPPGGRTAAQWFWSKEVCDKERSLEEQSFEILFFL